MRPLALALIVAAAIAAGPQRTVLDAAQSPATHEDPDAHLGLDHGAVQTAPHEGATDYLTLNVTISNDGLQPAVVFVPAGRPIQLMLRNRGSTEHHYRVLGLVPDDLVWVSRVDGAQQGNAVDDEHNHHNRELVRQRAASPAGIRPTGREVHAYAAGGSGVDVVLFSATQTGTFVVQCDLHPDQGGTLVVFNGAGPPADDQVSPGRRRALALALSKDLGSVDYPGAPGVQVEATYATEE